MRAAEVFFFLIKPPNDRPTDRRLLLYDSKGRISVASRFAKTEAADQQGSSGTFLSSPPGNIFTETRSFPSSVLQALNFPQC